MHCNTEQVKGLWRIHPPLRLPHRNNGHCLNYNLRLCTKVTFCISVVEKFLKVGESLTKTWLALFVIMNRLAVSRSARAQQAHKVNNSINQLIPVGTGPFKQYIITYENSSSRNTSYQGFGGMVGNVLQSIVTTFLLNQNLNSQYMGHHLTKITLPSLNICDDLCIKRNRPMGVVFSKTTIFYLNCSHMSLSSYWSRLWHEERQRWRWWSQAGDDEGDDVRNR